MRAVVNFANIYEICENPAKTSFISAHKLL